MISVMSAVCLPSAVCLFSSQLCDACRYDLSGAVSKKLLGIKSYDFCDVRCLFTFSYLFTLVSNSAYCRYDFIGAIQSC